MQNQAQQQGQNKNQDISQQLNCTLDLEEPEIIKEKLGEDTFDELKQLEEFDLDNMDNKIQEAQGREKKYDSDLMLLEKFEEEQKIREEEEEQQQNSNQNSVKNQSTPLKNNSKISEISINCPQCTTKQNKENIQQCENCKNQNANNQNNVNKMNCNHTVQSTNHTDNNTKKSQINSNLTFQLQTSNSHKLSFSLTNENISSSTTYSFYQDQISQDSDKGAVDVKKMLKDMQPQERRKIEQQIMNQIKQQDIQSKFYLEKQWAVKYTKWLAGEHKQEIISVNNAFLLDSDKNLKQGLQKNIDFVLVNEFVWAILTELYGGGPEIKFKESDLKNDITMSFMNKDDLEILNLKGLRIDSVGFENSSNYCYMNAILQCLLNIPQLNYYFGYKQFLNVKHKTKKTFKYVHAYSELLSIIQNGHAHLVRKQQQNTQVPIVTPVTLKKLCRKQFDPSAQHDCQEFLRFFLSEIQDELNHLMPLQRPNDFPDSQTAHKFYVKFNNSIIDQLFAGQLTSQIVCQICKHISHTFDPFLDISLPINKDCNSLYDCINLLFQEEELDENYLCEKCKQRSKARRKIMISKTPKIMVLHVKRFKIFPRKRKIKDFIQFPLENFDIKNYCKDKNMRTSYELQSITCHSGSADCGHYVAFTKSQNKWKYYNDKSVKEVAPKQVEQREAYLLFYSRKENQEQLIQK